MKENKELVPVFSSKNFTNIAIVNNYLKKFCETNDELVKDSRVIYVGKKDYYKASQLGAECIVHGLLKDVKFVTPFKDFVDVETMMTYNKHKKFEEYVPLFRSEDFYQMEILDNYMTSKDFNVDKTLVGDQMVIYVDNKDYYDVSINGAMCIVDGLLNKINYVTPMKGVFTNNNVKEYDQAKELLF